MDREWTSVENAYQASKSTDPAVIDQFVSISAGEAKKLGRQVDVRPDWDDIKEKVMLTLLLLKFSVGSELTDKLVATEHALLEEGNSWNDRFWGVCPTGSGMGLNRLGYMLMVVRKIRRGS